MQIVLPYTISPGDPMDATKVQTNFQTIASHQIADGDVSTLAGISGAKIATNTMPGDRIATGTVALAQMGAGSVGTTQLVDLAVTKGKLSTTAGQRVTLSQAEIAIQTVAVTFSSFGTTTAASPVFDFRPYTSGGFIAVTVTGIVKMLNIIGSNYLENIVAVATAGGGPVVTTLSASTYQYLGSYIDQTTLVDTGSGMTATVHIVAIATS